jgi:hypothetical protein
LERSANLLVFEEWQLKSQVIIIEKTFLRADNPVEMCWLNQKFGRL